jgi:hypothetical protein
MRSSFKSLVAIAACACAGASSAAVLAGFSPYGDALNGVEVDDPILIGPFTQAFSAPGGATLDKIVWWGYRLEEASGGPHADDFTVKLGTVTQTGSLTTAVESVITNVDLIRYTLDVTDALLTDTSLSIVSNGLDFAWYWQAADASAFGNPDFRVAFNLLGTVPTATTPEPGSLALVALAGLALLAAQRKRAA